MQKNKNERTPFSPETGRIYRLASESGGDFYCERLQNCSRFNAWMVNVRSGWSFLAHGVGIYPDGRIDWDYSTDGRFTKFQLQEETYENEMPALGSTEAAVLTVVELIARAAQMSEVHLSYLLDLYYQVRFKHEAAEIYGELAERTDGPDPVMARLDELEKKIDELKNGVTLKMDVRPVHPAPYRTAEDVIRIRPEDLAAEPDPAAAFIKQFAEADEGDTSSDAARHLPLEGKAEEDQTPVMRGRETIKLQERAKSETRSEAVKKQKAAEREFKIRVAERLREARTRGVKIGDIVTASCGKVPDGAVLTILDGGFRPIADYRALDAALDQLAVEK